MPSNSIAPDCMNDFKSLSDLPFSVCHSEAKPKNLGWVPPFATQMLHCVQHDRR